VPEEHAEDTLRCSACGQQHDGDHDCPEAPRETDGGEIQKYDPEHTAALRVGDQLANAADGMEEFNRLLWQVARTIYIVVSILLAISFVVMAYYAAEFLVTL